VIARARKFFSSSFQQPIGTHVELDAVRGYHIDMRVKAQRAAWPEAWPWAPGEQSWIALAQLGLGAHERWVAGEGEQWLATARGVGDMMCGNQVEGGPRDGGWEHRFDLPHTYELRAPWVSAMAQGEGASLLVRLHAATADERYAQAAQRALRLLAVSTEEGGTSALLDGRPFPQEYPTSPPSFVLNGGIFAIWGWYDVAVALGDAGARAAFDDAVETLARSIDRWDSGWWSLYDLYPHRFANPASFAYHELHIAQLLAMHRIAPRPQLMEAADRFAGYETSAVKRARAFATKAAFRVAVPRRRRAA
jgi:heparosan-N-sulfate-glucuronate 5-epimerase